MVESTENIKVVVRIRPIQLHEKSKGEKSSISSNEDGNEVQVQVGPREAHVFRCSYCFPQNAPQEHFFNACGIKDLLDSAMDGYRGCAFAFGQTGSGKTFTMVGNAMPTVAKHSSDGLIGRSLRYVYEKLEALDISFVVRLSSVEIYHENAFDLLSEDYERVSLPVREHARDGFFVEGKKNIPCRDLDTAYEIVSKNPTELDADRNEMLEDFVLLGDVIVELRTCEELCDVLPMKSGEYDIMQVMNDNPACVYDEQSVHRSN
eukprot:gene2705-5323_t